MVHILSMININCCYPFSLKKLSWWSESRYDPLYFINEMPEGFLGPGVGDCRAWTDTRALGWVQGCISPHLPQCSGGAAPGAPLPLCSRSCFMIQSPFLAQTVAGSNEASCGFLLRPSPLITPLPLLHPETQRAPSTSFLQGQRSGPNLSHSHC